MAVPVYLIPSPIGDRLNDFSVAAIRTIPQLTHLFLEADDGFAERMKRNKVITAAHQLTFLRDQRGDPEPAIHMARSLVRQGTPFGLLASSGIPCFVDPGYRLIDALMTHHSDEIELIPLGLSSALDAALMMAGVDMTLFVMLGHYPQYYRFPPALPVEFSLVAFVRGDHIRGFLREARAQVPDLQRILLLQNVRKRQDARVWWFSVDEPDPADLREHPGFDFVTALIRRPAAQASAERELRDG